MEKLYVLIDSIRDEDSCGCRLVGTYTSLGQAQSAMVTEYQEVTANWPDGDHKIDQTSAYAFDSDMFDWTAWHHWTIFDADDKETGIVWF